MLLFLHVQSRLAGHVPYFPTVLSLLNVVLLWRVRWTAMGVGRVHCSPLLDDLDT